MKLLETLLCRRTTVKEELALQLFLKLKIFSMIFYLAKFSMVVKNYPLSMICSKGWNCMVKKNDNFLPNNLYEMMSDIFCFHKANKFNRENEIRLLVGDSKPSVYDKHNNLL